MQISKLFHNKGAIEYYTLPSTKLQNYSTTKGRQNNPDLIQHPLTNFLIRIKMTTLKERVAKEKKEAERRGGPFIQPCQQEALLISCSIKNPNLPRQPPMRYHPRTKQRIGPRSDLAGCAPSSSFLSSDGSFFYRTPMTLRYLSLLHLSLYRRRGGWRGWNGREGASRRVIRRDLRDEREFGEYRG